MLLVSVVLSVGLLLFANYSAKRSGRLGPACWIAGLGAFFGFPCAFFPALCLGGLLTAFVGLMLAGTGGGTRRFVIGSVGAMVVAHLLVGAHAHTTVREGQELRTDYPFESMAERLGYEGRGTRLARTASPLSAPTTDEIHELERLIGTGWSIRTYALSRLHENAVTEFIDSPGFGVMRLLQPSRFHIELPEEDPISLPSPSEAVADAATPLPPVPFSSGAELYGFPSDGALRGFHRDSLIDFVNVRGFGYIKDRQHVRGFQSHRFRSMPNPPKEASEARSWGIENLQLVSLLKHDVPVAYVSKELPRMDALSHAATRPLDVFEESALSALQEGETLVVRSLPDSLRMLGAVRAIQQCQSCHEAERGELLGAFSYTLRPALANAR